MALINVLVVAGEASGDQHAAEVIREIQKSRDDIRFFGMGGERMEAAGAELLFRSSEISVMGITEVLPKAPRILKILHLLDRASYRRQAKAALLIDVPDFNLRLARRLTRRDIKVIYYISPMVWAWRKGRIKQIRRDVSQMLCILPFEEAFYRENGVAARYVGNPVVRQVPPPASVETFRAQLGINPTDSPILALLPGSRPSELKRMLPPLLDAVELLQRHHPNLKVVVPIASGLFPGWVEEQFERRRLSVQFVRGRAPQVLGACDVAVVTSGTAVLEAGLMLKPTVVVYRVSFISSVIGRLLLRVAHVALVNLLLRRRLFPELLQKQLSGPAVAQQVTDLLSSSDRRETIIGGLKELRSLLGDLAAPIEVARTLLPYLNEVPRAP